MSILLVLSMVIILFTFSVALSRSYAIKSTNFSFFVAIQYITYHRATIAVFPHSLNHIMRAFLSQLAIFIISL